jgi:dienelactone hydrolase
VIDTASGKSTGSFDIVGDTDDVFYDAARHGFAVRTHPGYAEDAAKQSFDEAKRFLARYLPVTG